MRDDLGFDRCRLYRDRLIASPRVQRWALANPLTRPIARRRARAMLDLCAGFVYSQVLFTCVRLRLFDILFNRNGNDDVCKIQNSFVFPRIDGREIPACG
jgi:hypothetical protein